MGHHTAADKKQMARYKNEPLLACYHVFNEVKQEQMSVATLNFSVINHWFLCVTLDIYQISHFSHIAVKSHNSQKTNEIDKTNTI